MADFGATEILAAETMGLESLGPSVLGAEAAFGAPAAAGLISPAVTGIAGLSGAGMGAAGWGGAMAGLGETPYLTAYSEALNAGATVPEASQAAIQAANAANPATANPAMDQMTSQNLANVGGEEYQVTAKDGIDLPSRFNVSFDQAEPELTTADSKFGVNPNAPQDFGLKPPAESVTSVPSATTATESTPLFGQQQPTNPFGGITDLMKSAYKGFKDMSPAEKIMSGMGASIAADKLFGPKYGVPTPQKYSGPLSKFSYNPLTYTPAANPRAVYPGRGYADGGITQLGVNPNFPMANQQASRYAVASQMPAGAQAVRMANLPPVSMARGGELGGYSDGGRMLKGPGDGMSDSIPASISGKQPARLADGEFVVPADVVSHLGNGSTDAGAKQLYKMMDKVRTARTGRKSQGRQINPKKYMPA